MKHHTEESYTMTSYGKPRDKVSSYAKGGSSWSNPKPSQSSSAHPNDASLKKKHYRARGCRGGASRKGRKKQLNRQQHDERELQENLDPCPSTTLPTSGFIPEDIEVEPKQILVTSSSHHNNINSYEKNQKKVTFAPHTEKHSYINHNIEPKEGKRHKFMHTFAGFGHKQTVPPQAYKTSMSILPQESDVDGNIELLLDENANPNSAVSPTNRATITKGSPARSPGFSFFSISPRSYLTGRKSKAQS